MIPLVAGVEVGAAEEVVGLAVVAALVEVIVVMEPAPGTHWPGCVGECSAEVRIMRSYYNMHPEPNNSIHLRTLSLQSILFESQHSADCTLSPQY